MSEQCGAVSPGGYVCDYPNGHEHDEARHYYDRYYHHEAKGVVAGCAAAVEWKVDGAPPEPPR